MIWALVAVIAALLIERVVHERAVSADRRKLVNALVARDATELGYLDRVERVPRTKVAPNGDERPRAMPEGL